MSDPTTTATGSAPAPGGGLSLSFVQTKMGSDRTLMAILRTSLSLISFGFTIHQVLGRASALLPRGSVTARNVGLALLILGLVMLTMGVISHALFARELLRMQERPEEILGGKAMRYETASIYVSALSLLAVGLAALVAIAIHLTR
jgi:putative membrane protein